jgi:hypothetical protein
MRASRVFLFLAVAALTATACFPPGGGTPGGGTPGGGTPGGGTPGGGTPGGGTPGGGTPGGGGGGIGAGDQNGPLGGCPGFPPDGASYVGWGVDVSALPVDPNSADYIAHILGNSTTDTDKLHADFGGGGAYGIPYVTVPGSEAGVPVDFTAYGAESDPGPYKIPLGAPVEGGPGSDGDRHVLAIDRDNCILYELYRAFPRSSSWDADSGVDWDLRSSALRTPTWTSADAAGLPIFPGLVRYDEIAAGAINHALRFTVRRTQAGYVLPATHWAPTCTSSCPDAPPMGLRLRLRAGFDISGFTGQSRVILEALKKYGMIVADNGSNWFISGAADSRFDDHDLNQLKTVPGTAFEVVDTGDVCRTDDGSQPPSVCG